MARLTAWTLARRITVVDRDRPGWEMEFAAEVDGAMDQYLEGFADSGRTRALLLPLAYARGFGLPADGRLWARLATALSGRLYVSADVDEVRRTAADYLLEEVGERRPYLRLFHQALADALLHDRPHPAADEEEIARALAEPNAQDPRLLPDDGYSRPCLAYHAAAAGLLDDYLVDPGVLVSARPVRLLQVLTNTYLRRPKARRWAKAYKYAAPRLGRDPGANASYLGQAAHHLQEGALSAAIRQVRVERPFRTVWATRRMVTADGSRAEPEVEVSGVAVCSHQGRTLVVSAGDGTVRLWDPDLPEADAVVLRGHEGRINAVAVCSHRGRLLVASGGDDRTVRLWDPDRSRADSIVLRGHASSVKTVAVGSHRDQTLVASGGADGTIRLWDPDRSDVDSTVLKAYLGPVRGIAVGSHRGRMLVVSAGEDTVRLWDPDRPQAYPVVLHGNWGWAMAVAVCSQRDRTLVVSGGDAVRVWNLDRLGADPLVLGGYASWGWIGSIAVGSHRGRTLVMTGGGNTMRLWELDRPERRFDGIRFPSPIAGLATTDGGAIIVATQDGVDLIELGEPSDSL